MKIAIACDHGAYEYKEMIKAMLEQEGHEVLDFGTDSTASVDYPGSCPALCAGGSEGRGRARASCCAAPASGYRSRPTR